MSDLGGTRVLVTGGTGFIGSHLVRRLVALGAEVHVVTSTVSSVYPVRLTDVREDVALHEASVTDRTAIGRVVDASQPELVFHLAAYTHVGKSWQRLDECVQTNVQGTVNLLQVLAEIDYARFVNVGTSEIYGAADVPFREDHTCPRPVSPYAVSKQAAEAFCRLGYQSHRWPVVLLRPFNAYGPAQSPDRVIPEIIARGLRRQHVRLTSGEQTREFNYVGDLVDGLIAVGTSVGLEGELINLCGGTEISIADLATTLLEVMGDPVEAKLGALPDRPVRIDRMYGDPTKARRLLGWEPRHSLRAGLGATVDWYRSEFERDPDSPFIPGFERGN